MFHFKNFIIISNFTFCFIYQAIYLVIIYFIYQITFTYSRLLVTIFIDSLFYYIYIKVPIFYYIGAYDSFIRENFSLA